MGEIVLDRIDQSKLRESVYAALHAAFTRGAYAPADVLSLRSLAEQLGTSMTPFVRRFAGSLPRAHWSTPLRARCRCHPSIRKG